MDSAFCDGDQAETGAKFVTDSELGGKYTTGFVAGKNVRQDMIKVSLDGTPEQVRDYYNEISDYYDEVSIFTVSHLYLHYQYIFTNIHSIKRVGV